MSANAIRLDGRPARFWTSTNGKKAVMALSGIVLVGFVVVHLLGNLQVFAGADKFNAYAHALKGMAPLLWTVRLMLLAAVCLHIWSAFSLWRIKAEARPIGYVTKKTIASTYASRTMYWSGPILLLFIIYHLMQFTIGIGGTRFIQDEAYDNLVAGFEVPAVSVFYIIAMGCLCLHLYHGVWSMLQTLGIQHPKYTPVLRVLAKVLAVAVFLGFTSIPLGVMLGRIQPSGIF
ncbi:MAG TPA: succinate dehydrogenase cytochrome b subunit [Bryobacteraceae bacterium]|jgi:succinate dehydrogenase / fumarate reductase cytochrome b subunit